MISSDVDLSFYNGKPVEINGTGWLALIASLTIAFLALTFIPLRTFPYNFVPALVFVGIPILALSKVAGSQWKCLFRAVNFRSLALMALFGVTTLVGSMAVGWILQQFVVLHSNPVADQLAAMSASEIGATFIVTGIQLVGEELFGVLSFLAILWFCVQVLYFSRRSGILIALIISALLFGAAHLPTYDWHWAQSLIGIGFARVILTLAYIVTRNLWVSAGAHIINDWTGFVLMFEFGHVSQLGGVNAFP
ncbi:membrane protease YdiL (CAAX protease family) [Rhizobium sp. BIGb0125]|jgi:membrane protease YdiL (CAAX protease family)|uniref:CPBP family intramembrane glutamic endopeptidase n=1 Tax=Rhizobium/Agrobacterium group TaxID=227290 RepID=UPI002169B8DE|nr:MULTISPECIES: type II CAAX endopeptidase family protein [Rhizobium/Agrobacterium group]MCS4245653.1 membrane protease YdiL (CAAX protease family) [Rhizobium sp. BIGb0125]MDO5898177.1 type II CAAX endopeptidase family protein [Agrobacterium sp. Azo12]